MSNEKNNVACLFFQLSIESIFPHQRYNCLAECAVNSFTKFNPDVQVFHITDNNVEEYAQIIGEEVEFYDQIGIVRYIFAEHLMRKLNIKKMIILGVDTITCGRLDEFLDDDSVDILATLNYPCVESTPYWKTNIIEFDVDGQKIYDFYNVNADAVCFNNVEALSKVNKLSIEHYSGFAEQGGLNEVVLNYSNEFLHKIVDFPYHSSKVVYNARSKGVFGTGMNNETTPQMYFYVRDGKLYTHDHKQIKVWHYIEGLSGQNEFEFKALIDKWKFKLFNKDTINFFKEQCDCKDFFEREYDIKRDWFGV